MRSLKDERPHVMRRSSERSMDISGLSLGKNVECHVLHVAKSSPTTRHVLAIGTVHNESASTHRNSSPIRKGPEHRSDL